MPTTQLNCSYQDAAAADLELLLRNKFQTVFLLGEFGVGKSHLIEKLTKTNKEIVIKNLSNSSSYEDAFNIIIPKWKKSIILLILIVFAIGIINPLFGYINTYLLKIKFLSTYSTLDSSSAMSLLLFICGYFFITNKWLWLYSISNFFSVLDRNKVYILEDMERSDLSNGTIWEIIKTLKAHRRLIVVLGYRTQEERIEYIEKILKLDGKYVSLQPSNKTIFDIAKKLDSNFPFIFDTQQDQTNSWLGLLTPRKIISVVENVNSIVPPEKESLRAVYYLHYILRSLLDSVNFNDAEIIYMNITSESRLRLNYRREGLPAEYVNAINTMLQSAYDYKLGASIVNESFREVIRPISNRESFEIISLVLIKKT